MSRALFICVLRIMVPKEYQESFMEEVAQELGLHG